MTQNHEREASQACPSCGSNSVTEANVSQSFPFGEDEILLEVIVPVVSCGACGFSYTDHRAEHARHAAVCRYEQLLTPDEIKGIRKKLAMSRKDFNEAFGVPPASMERWENGRLLQNRSSDTLLRALSNPATAERLDRRVALRKTNAAATTVLRGRFPALEAAPNIMAEAQARQNRFLLRVGV